MKKEKWISLFQLPASSRQLPTFLCFCLFAALCLPDISAQATDDDMEAFVEAAAQETEVSPLIEAVDYFSLHPLPLRTARAKELMVLPGFSQTTARAVVALARIDSIQSCQQIAAVLGLTSEQAQILCMCTTLDRTTAPLAVTWRVRCRGRLNTLRGTDNGSFLGSPIELHQRLSAALPAIEASVVADKDAGERSVADFAGGYVRWKPGQTLVLLGDYSIQSGMGTILGRPFGARKGSDVLSPAVRSHTAVAPQHSAIEQNFFRGIALEHSFADTDSNSWTAALWFSSLKRAAALDTTTGAITSVDGDGYFRTASELAKRGVVSEQAAGVLVEWQRMRFAFGAAILGLRYNKPIRSTAQNAFSGSRGVLFALHGNAAFGTLTATAETARDASGYIGVRIGAEQRDSTMRFALSFRSFPADFRSPFGSSFGESPLPANETGVYIGWAWRVSKPLRVALYTDIYRTYEPPSSAPVPVRGLDLSGEGNLDISRATSLAFRFRREDKTDALTIDERRIALQKVRYSVRAELTHDLRDSLRIRLRCEAAAISFEKHKHTETGLLNFAEVRYRISSFSLSTRLVYFATDSFQSAIWAYEQTVPGMMSAPARYGSGMRWTAALQYRAAKAFTMSLFLGITAINDVETLGSGLLEMEGNTERQFAVQVDMAL